MSRYDGKQTRRLSCPGGEICRYPGTQTLPETPARVPLQLERQLSDQQDPNLRRRLILQDIDRRPFGQAHVRAVLVAGTGFLTDSYDVRATPPFF